MLKKVVYSFKLVIILLLIIISVTFVKTKVSAEEKIDLSGQNSVVIDVYDDEIIYEKDKDERVFPASITKVLTAIIADEMLEDGQKIKASENAIKEEPSNQLFLLKEGEEITKEDALKLMMMISSNDVSMAVAEEISGSVEDFTKIMNKKAEEFGAKNSNFETPNGLPNEKQKTTAYDMSMITKEVMNHPNVLEAMKTKKHKIKTSEREVEIEKTHSIFEKNKNAIGGKTGWTIDSGNTLVEILEKDDTTVVAVTMGASNSDSAYNDIQELSDLAFKKIETMNLFSKGDFITKINRGENSFNLYAKEDVTVSVNKRDNIDNKIMLKNIDNYKKGDEIGELVIVDEDGDKERSFKLKSDKDISVVNKTEDKTKITKGFEFNLKENNSVLIILLILISTPIAMFSLLLLINKVLNRDKFSLSNQKRPN